MSKKVFRNVASTVVREKAKLMEIFYEYLPRLHGAATFGKTTLCGVTFKSCTLQNGTQRNEVCWLMSVLLNVVSCSALLSVILLN